MQFLISGSVGTGESKTPVRNGTFRPSAVGGNKPLRWRAYFTRLGEGPTFQNWPSHISPVSKSKQPCPCIAPSQNWPSYIVSPCLRYSPACAIVKRTAPACERSVMMLCFFPALNLEVERGSFALLPCHDWSIVRSGVSGKCC